MKPPVPLFFTCTTCGHVHSETLQDLVSGKLPQPLTCPACRTELNVDWDWINDQAQQLGLVFPAR
jgi:hypothetical protein